MTKQTHNDETALDAFCDALSDARDLLTELGAAVDDHMGASPETVNWGHVGSAHLLLLRLREACEALPGRSA